MISFRDVARQIESNAVASTMRALPVEATLSPALTRAGGPQNLLTSNADPDAPRYAPDGTPLILLRTDNIPINKGLLAP